CHQFAHEIVHAGCVAARPIEAGDEAEFDRVVADIEDDGSPTARGDRGARCTGIGPGDNDRRLSSDEISGQQWEPVVLPLSIAILDCYVPVFDVARFGQGPEKCRQIRRARSWRSRVKKADHRHRWLLRPGRERPRGGRAAERGQQFPSSDGDCHTRLPCEVRKENDTTPRECRLHAQGGLDSGAGCTEKKDERLSPLSPLASKVRRNSSRPVLRCHLANRALAKTVFLARPRTHKSRLFGDRWLAAIRARSEQSVLNFIASRSSF